MSGAPIHSANPPSPSRVNASLVRGEPASERIGIAAAAGFLLVAPVTSSPGLRMALLTIAAACFA